MRLVLAGVVASALTVSLGAATAHAQVFISGSGIAAETDISPEQEQFLLGEYWTIARRYKSESERAIREMTAWTRDRIGKVQSLQFQPERARPEYLESKAVWDPPTLRVAAMLHSDVALAAFRARNMQEFEFQVGIADGWLALADNRQSTPGSLRSRWNVTIGRLLLANGETGIAEQHLMRINERIAGDIAILLAYGTVKETQATRAASRYAGPRLEEPTIAGKERAASLAHAISLLEKVIAIEPGIGEAKLRLAHLYNLKGDYHKAEATLLPLLQRPQPPSSKYLASMFVGQAREALGNLDAAARHYLDAMNAVPDAQSAYLALAQVLRKSGRDDDAATVIERLSGRGNRDVSSDPWWTYPLGLDLSFEARFEEYRADVRR